MSKVDLALRVVKSHAHRLELLTHANSSAVRMLSHGLREAAEACRLEKSEPQPALIERYGARRNAFINVAACIAILFLTKVGLFSSFEEVRIRGQAVMRHYYASQVGEDLAGEVF